MKRIIILGAGGLGRQVLAQLQVDYGHGIDWVIGGFLDERGPDAVAESLYYPWLGYPESFVAEPDQLFVAAVGDPLSRQKQVACLLAKGAEFVAIRTRCTLGVRTSYGPTFFGYDVSSGVDCRIGAYGFIDQQTMLGHDVVIGDYVHIGPRCLLAGYVKVGDRAVINSGAMIARDVSIGEDAVVGMGAVVFRTWRPDRPWSAIRPGLFSASEGCGCGHDSPCAGRSALHRAADARAGARKAVRQALDLRRLQFDGARAQSVLHPQDRRRAGRGAAYRVRHPGLSQPVSASSVGHPDRMHRPATAGLPVPCLVVRRRGAATGHSELQSVPVQRRGAGADRLAQAAPGRGGATAVRQPGGRPAAAARAVRRWIPGNLAGGLLAPGYAADLQLPQGALQLEAEHGEREGLQPCSFRPSEDLPPGDDRPGARSGTRGCGAIRGAAPAAGRRNAGAAFAELPHQGADPALQELVLRPL